jgi:sugar lactone lactonase YvrE
VPRKAQAIASRSLSSDGLGRRAWGLRRPRSRLRFVGVAIAATTVLALALFAAPTLAAQTHAFSTSFGTSGSGDGQVSSPQGVPVNSTTHDVYVADTGNARIDQFDSSGAFIRAFGADVGGSGINVCTSGCVAGTVGSAPGQFTLPTFIAVDNSGGASQGDVYVGDTGTNLVQKFDSSGNLIASWGSGGQLDGSSATTPITGPFGTLGGITVDSSGNLWAYDQGGNMFEFAEDSTFATDWNSGRGVTPNGIDADSAGNLYVLTGAGTVEQFSSTGTDVGPVNGDASDPTGFAIDRSTDEVYMDSGGTLIRHYAASCDAGGSCAATDTFGSPQLSGAAGLGVDPSNTTVYAADTADQRVAVFAPVTLPDVTTNPASAIGKHSATLNGHLDPAGGVDISDCQFQYTDDATFQSQGYIGASSIACDQSTPISSPTDVTASPTGLDAGTVYHFRLIGANANGGAEGADQTFTTAPALDLTINPADPVGAFTATLNGHLDSNGGGDATDCHFEYADDASFQANGFIGAQTAPCVPAAPISSPTDVTADISGLTSETTYHVRLVATNSDGTTKTGDLPFSTLALPHIVSASAANLTATAADLTAAINPEGADTTYRFEWGTDITYGTSVPVPDADIGAGTTDVTVIQHLSDLTANTTYHFRVVATSANGSTTSPDHTFIYDTTGQGLPDNRAYEMVTPPQKNGALVQNGAAMPNPALSSDGSRLIYYSLQCLPGAGSCNANRLKNGEPYLAARAPSGWDTTSLAPPAGQFDVNTVFAANADTGRTLFSVPTPPTGQDDWYAGDAAGSLRDLGPASLPAGGPLGVGPFGIYAQAATADLSHLVWGSSSPFWPFDSTTGNPSLYEYTGSGNSQPLLVGVSGGQGSTDLISTCGTLLGNESVFPNPGPMSADGSTVFFTAGACDSGSGANAGTPVPANALYARIDGTLPGARTVAISQRSPTDCGVPSGCLGSPPGDANFEAGSTDGSRVFFTSTQQLTDEAGEDSGESAGACSQTTGPNGCNLYLYDFANPAGHELIDASAGDTSGGGPRVQGILGVSDDGSHAYFVAKGVLTSAPNSRGESATDGAFNLYLYERDPQFPGGHIAFVAALSAENFGFAASDSGQWLGPGRKANVTPDGRFLVFTSTAQLTPDDSSTGDAQQVFRYDASTGQLERISVGNNGFNDNGNAGVGAAEIVPARNTSLLGLLGPSRPDPTMSHDGAYVFFMSPIALTPHALDDVPIGTDPITGKTAYAQNVYAWHDGHVSLISDGRDVASLSTNMCANPGVSSVCLIGADASGANVFFTSADKLVPQDSDTQLDIYDARVGGGIPFTPPPEPCLGDNCKPPPTGSPTDPTPGSSGSNAPGNQGKNRGGSVTAPAHKKKCKKHHKKKCRKHSRAADTSGRAGG